MMTPKVSTAGTGKWLKKPAKQKGRSGNSKKLKSLLKNKTKQKKRNIYGYVMHISNSPLLEDQSY